FDEDGEHITGADTGDGDGLASGHEVEHPIGRAGKLIRTAIAFENRERDTLITFDGEAVRAVGRRFPADSDILPIVAIATGGRRERRAGACRDGDDVLAHGAPGTLVGAAAFEHGLEGVGPAGSDARVEYDRVAFPCGDAQTR